MKNRAGRTVVFAICGIILLESLEFTTEGGSQTFLLYSNVPEWSIRCRYGDEWIDVWPAEGDFDGRFSVTVDENNRAELRYDHLEIYAGGELMRTLEGRQQAPAPAIATNFTEKQVAASAASFDVLVTCNAEWRAEVSPKDEAWLSLGERTATRLNVVCAVNDTGASREGAVRLYIPGTACEVSWAGLPARTIPCRRLCPTTGVWLRGSGLRRRSRFTPVRH